MTRITHAELPADLAVHNNLVRTTYVNPDMYRGFASLSGRVHSASHLPPRIRELVVLCIAGMLGADYERQQHERGARLAGITDADLEALQRADFDHFEGADREAVRFAAAVEARRVDDAVWARAREVFAEVELLDIAMLAGFYGLASRLVLALDVDLEEPAPGPEQ
jgi:alkylhydroperoxidase family enzyme